MSAPVTIYCNMLVIRGCTLQVIYLNLKLLGITMQLKQTEPRHKWYQFISTTSQYLHWVSRYLNERCQDQLVKLLARPKVSLIFTAYDKIQHFKKRHFIVMSACIVTTKIHCVILMYRSQIDYNMTMISQRNCTITEVASSGTLIPYQLWAADTWVEIVRSSRDTASCMTLKKKKT